MKSIKTKSNSLSKWFNEKFAPFINRLNNQIYLASIRDSFSIMIPFIIAGSMGSLISAIIFGGGGSGYVSLLGLICKLANHNLPWTSNIVGVANVDSIINGYGIFANSQWHKVSLIFGTAFADISSITINQLSLAFSFLIGFFIAKNRFFWSPIIVGIITAGSFELFCLGKFDFFSSANGLITSMIFGVINAEVFIWLMSFDKITIKIFDDMPKILKDGFAILVPTLIVFAGDALLDSIFMLGSTYSDKMSIISNKDIQINNADLTKNQLDHIKSSLDDETFKKIESCIFENKINLIKLDDLYDSSDSVGKSKIAYAIIQMSGVNSNYIYNPSNCVLRMIIYPDLYGKTIILGSYSTKEIEGVNFGVAAFVYWILTDWLIDFISTDGQISVAIIFIFFVSFFWFFGIHGSNILLSIFQPILWMLFAINNSLVLTLGYDAAVATGYMNVVNSSFINSFVWIGGSGATLGLIFVLIVFSKRKKMREVAKISLPVGIFQMNEPVLFGIRIILNPIFFLPFVLAPLVNFGISYSFSPAVLGFVKYAYIAPPWPAPFIFAAVLSTIDIRALLPSIICVIVDCVIYLPFVLIDNFFYIKFLKNKDLELYEKVQLYNSNKLERYKINTEYRLEQLKSTKELLIKKNKDEIETMHSIYGDSDYYFYKKTKIEEKIKYITKKYKHKIKLFEANRQQKYLLLETSYNLRKTNKQGKKIK